VRLAPATTSQQTDHFRPRAARAVAVRVIPIDQEAPKGTHHSPAGHAIQNLLDGESLALVRPGPRTADRTLDGLRLPPAPWSPDSQAFETAGAGRRAAGGADDSFSIPDGALPGRPRDAGRGTLAIGQLADGGPRADRETCTTIRSARYPGAVKRSRKWLRSESTRGPILQFSHVQAAISRTTCRLYRLVSTAELHGQPPPRCSRGFTAAVSRRVPITNYGLTIAVLSACLARALRAVPSALEAWHAAPR